MININNNNICQIKINGVNIQLAKINGSIVFEINGEIITLSFNEKTISAISNKSGSYDFYYAKDGEILEEYDKIVTFNLTADVESSYNYLNSFNIAPYNANEIVVCKSGTTKILSSSSLPSQFLFDSSTYGNKLYSFGALSDVHLDGDGTDEASSSSDFTRALNFFNSNANLVAISGDVANVAGYDELATYKNLVDNNSTIPVYTSRGNHDCFYSLDDWLTYTGESLYHEKIYNNDVFLFVGMNTNSYGDNCFTTETLSWLETKLKSYKNQRVFLFFHVFMPNTCGNINSLYPYKGLDTSSTSIQKFIELMTTYKNVIYFSGHSHLEFACQKFGENANIFSDGSICHRVHIPSCAKPRTNDNGTSSSETYYHADGSEGYLVDVYENCIILRGRDFIKGKYLPIANYLLDTTIIPIEDIEEVTNIFKTSEILYSNSGSQYASGKVRAGVTYTYETGSENVTLNGTPTSSYVQGFKVVHTMEAGKTYRMYVEDVSGTVDVGEKGYGVTVNYKVGLTGVPFAVCYTASTNETSYPSEIEFTQEETWTEWYVMIQQPSSGVTYNEHTFAIHVEEIEEFDITG